ncbi:hypothetical protein ACFE04_005557 [Oxalis oulophora]
MAANTFMSYAVDNKSDPCSNSIVRSWEEDVVCMVEDKQNKDKIVVSFVCETLKADKEAEDHISKYMPKLSGLDAVVNVGQMSISGLNFDAEEEGSNQNT